ncbi:hypothetical protein MOR12E_28815 [Methylobacterium oryzae]
MISFSEGTYAKGHHGYNVLYGGGYFTGYADHPRKKLTFTIKGKSVTSTAAGRYQILARYFDAYKKSLGLKDFSPASQDAIAVQMIKEQKALQNIEAGRFDEAVRQCSNIWASLPGAGYGQHENSLEALREFYVRMGGRVA